VTYGVADEYKYSGETSWLHIHDERVRREEEIDRPINQLNYLLISVV